MTKSIFNFFKIQYGKHYRDKYRHAKKLFIFDIFLLSVAVAMLGSTLYFLFWNPGLTDQIDLKISLGDGRIKSGEEISLIVEYKNRSKFTLNNATVALHLPPGFVVDRTKTPVEIFSNQSTFAIDHIKPGAHGQLSVQGYMWATPKTDYDITALLSYLPENSKNREQKLGSFLMNLPDSILQTTLNISTTSFANNTVPFSFTIKNTSNQTVSDLDLSVTFPGKLNIDETKIKNIDLEKDSQKIIEGTIIMPAKSGQYDLNIAVNGNFNNNLVKILETKNTIKTFSPQMDISAKFNDEEIYGEPKSELNASVAWKNSGQFNLQNQNIYIDFTPGTVDLASTAKANNFKTSNGRLIINSLSRTALSNGTPGADDEFNFKIVLLPHFSLGEANNPTLDIKPAFSAELKDMGGQRFEIDGQGDSLPLATELNLLSNTRYYSDDGDQLGRGPLPLAVGQTTKYWIFIQVNNTTNPVKDAKLEVVLDQNITFTGKQSVTIGPALTTNSNNLSWSYRELPPHSQTGWYIEVAVTPTADQLGKNLNLVNSIKFSATDKTTGKSYLLQKGALNNILPSADIGSKKSSVVQ